ncbi:YtjB family periplasmic protein [Avibacterium paragallinarum]|uniref:YtjB family periplasmic protein n=1 Tax=Avibacterium paragallinarum TaxID=728 RepID=UPI0039886B0D
MPLIKEKALKIMMLLVIVGFCAGIVGVVFFGVQQFKWGSQLASINQVTNLSHLLVRQQTHLFSILLINNAKAEQLTENLDKFTKEGFIVDASIYSNKGELLAQSSNHALSHFPSNSEATPNKDYQQVVEPIYSANGVEGFLRVTFNSKYRQTTQQKINQIFNRLYGELIILFFTGFLLASSLYYFIKHYRRHKPHKSTVPTVVQTPRIASRLTYHRRRKGLRK